MDATLGPFDGVLGFSQGAALAGLYALQRQRGRYAGSSPADEEHYAELAADVAPSPPLRFAVFCGGYVCAQLKA